ncbi:MAG: PIN domain-containing protein [Desulfurococcales archaeon]|nr:PIN domain-containing protein [Desulfurococcales archaeon]
MIFLDTNILYHILHRTPRTEEALNLLEENPGDYVIDFVVHNEIIYAPTIHYLEHRYRIKETYIVNKWIKKNGYPGNVLNAIRRLIGRLSIRLIHYSVHRK